jgi:hypothetical protein
MAAGPLGSSGVRTKPSAWRPCCRSLRPRRTLHSVVAHALRSPVGKPAGLRRAVRCHARITDPVDTLPAQDPETGHTCPHRTGWTALDGFYDMCHVVPRDGPRTRTGAWSGPSKRYCRFSAFVSLTCPRSHISPFPTGGGRDACQTSPGSCTPSHATADTSDPRHDSVGPEAGTSSPEAPKRLCVRIRTVASISAVSPLGRGRVRGRDCGPSG